MLGPNNDADENNNYTQFFIHMFNGSHFVYKK